MSPARRAFRECRMQFPQHRATPRNHIVGIATFADTVESSFNRIACETAASARAACAPRRARGPDGMRLGSLIRAWVQHLACGPAIAGAGPLIRAWFRWYARGRRRPRASLGVGVRVAGLTRMFSGSCASDTPGQAPLRSKRRLPCPQLPVVGVCYRGGLRRGRRPEARPHRQQTGGIALHEDPCVSCLPMTAPPSGGNCIIRGATRRRHAEGRLLMLQNPHHYPWPGLVWFCGPGVLRVVGCYWWCCAHWRAYWLGESQLSALSRLSVLDGDSEVVTDG